MLIKLVCFVSLIAGVWTSSETVPRLDLTNVENGYHGLIREDEFTVTVKPLIRAIGKELCGFRILNRHHGETPFEVVLKDEETGEGELRSKRLLNCEKRNEYQFSIVAVACNGDISENATVHISVVDVNEYAPVFLEPSYVKQVDEGRLYDQILRLEATDRDCSAKFGDICKYEILTLDQPFAIDSDGVIKNTEALSYERSHNHILSVVAYDCGMKRSTPVLVTIKVGRVCSLGWKGIPERVDYAPGSSRQTLFPDASLELCDIPCSLSRIETKLTLSTAHIGKGCDRDTYAVTSQRKLCGASSESVDLLPPPSSLGSDWTKNLLSDEGHESDPLFEFDGTSTGTLLPKDLISEGGLSGNFTLSTWMKHSAHPDEDRHTKEHILCKADDHKMNRHHFAVFVRNCRLILLLRREHSDGDLNTFRPAEWRWKIPQVCDDEWHHYSLSVTFPDVLLYIDGLPFSSEKNNPEVIDDWPLHPAKGLTTFLSIGACWQGSEGKFKHFFKGYLAGLSVLEGRVEEEGVLRCLHKCKEQLEGPGIEVVEPGMQLMTNTDMTEITVEGENTTDIENLIQKIGYINSREFPTPGRRNLHLATKVICESGKAIKIIPSDSFLLVLPPQKPTIELNGTSNLSRDYEDFRLGVRVFSDIRISISSGGGDGVEEWTNGEPVSVIERKLDACTVSVYPPLNPDHELISIPQTMLSQLGISQKMSNDGILLSGADMIYNYEQVLRQIQYSNKKPAYYLNRAFKLICSELNGRFTSNEYVQTLTVIHPELWKSTEEPSVEEGIEDNSVAHALVQEHHVELQPPQHNNLYLGSNVLQTSQQVGGSHAVMVIIVVCVGFLLFMIVLGVIRIRAAQRRTQQEEMTDAEMAWDDSALNITVNPMEVCMTNMGSGGSVGGGNGSSMVDDGGESWDEEDEEEEEEEDYRGEEEEEDDEDDSSSGDERDNVVERKRRSILHTPSKVLSSLSKNSTNNTMSTSNNSTTVPLLPSVHYGDGRGAKELDWDNSCM